MFYVSHHFHDEKLETTGGADSQECRDGITVSWTQAEKLRWDELTDPEMRRVFIDPSTGEPWLEGDVYTRDDLADTLTALAEAGEGQSAHIACAKDSTPLCVLGSSSSYGSATRIEW